MTRPRPSLAELYRELNQRIWNGELPTLAARGVCSPQGIDVRRVRVSARRPWTVGFRPPSGVDTPARIRVPWKLPPARDRELLLAAMWECARYFHVPSIVRVPPAAR